MKKKKLSLAELLKALWQEKASNLIITVGVPPMLKKFNTLKPIGDTPLTPVQAEQLILSVLNEHQKNSLRKARNLTSHSGSRGWHDFWRQSLYNGEFLMRSFELSLSGFRPGKSSADQGMFFLFSIAPVVYASSPVNQAVVRQRLWHHSSII